MTDQEIGFTRKEFLEREKNLHGKGSPPLFRHAFYVLNQPASEWPSDCNEMEPLKTLNAVLDKDQIRLTAIEAIPGDLPGDVLIFPDFCRIRNVDLSTQEAITDFASRLMSSVPFLLGEDCEVLDLPQLFVCAHVKRDARCGFCGPKLMDAFALLNLPLQSRKCSHIGGHNTAGNVITFRKPSFPGEQSQGDWFGLVDPSKCSVIGSFCVDPVLGYPPHELHALWRGRCGVKNHTELGQAVNAACEMCTMADIEDGVVGRPSLCLDEDTDLVLEMEGEGSKKRGSAPFRQARVVFILGAPGSGKGTQCSNLIRDYDFIHLSAGDLLRDERNNPESSDGQLIETYIREGKIVPVKITVKLLWQKMQQCMEKDSRFNFLIDGFPRNQDNLEGWQEHIPVNQVRVLGVLFLDCPEDIVRDRLLERGMTSGRTDDNLDSILKRFKTFTQETMPIVDYFSGKHICWKLNSSLPKEEVYANVRTVVEDFVLPLKRFVVVVVTQPKYEKMAMLVKRELMEEFDVSLVEDASEASRQTTRNCLANSASSSSSGKTAIAGVLNLGATKTEIERVQQQLVNVVPVFHVDMKTSMSEVYAQARSAVQPVFLPTTTGTSNNNTKSSKIAAPPTSGSAADEAKKKKDLLLMETALAGLVFFSLLGATFLLWNAKRGRNNF